MKTLFALLTIFCLIQTGIVGQQYDYILLNGRVFDGSGNPWYYADIGISNDRIAAVGDLSSASAREIIDISGLYLSPGFIDIHSHALDPASAGRGLDSEDRRRREAPNLISQGITTVIVNQDGRSSTDTFSEQIAELESAGIGVNAGLMIGHNSIRRDALGENYQRFSTPSEIRAMKSVIRKAMQEGAFGLSAGLEYVPGRWSNTEEVIELVEEIVPFGGVYISHQRSEAKTPMLWLPSDEQPSPPTLLDAVEETIAIGEATGARVVASHLKSRGANYWGGSNAAVSLIEQARNRGVSVYADQYPYNTSGSDGNTRLIPNWAFDFQRFGLERNNSPNYTLPIEQILNDRELATSLYADISHSLAYRGGPERIVVFEFPDSSYIGKNIGQLAIENDLSPEDMVIELQRRGFENRRGGARLRSFSMHENDLNVIANTDWTATTTDGGITLPEDGNNVHARFYGTFPRKIFKYAVTNQTITVAHAIRSSTGLPAQIMDIRNRGLIREGYYADIVVFDLEEIQDQSTFFEPHQHSSGIEYVFVNGKPSLYQRNLTGTLSGKILTPSNSR
ncbi:MAG: N-acyl-D-amino-acid deacylase family protein [Balneola sp.]